MGELERWDIYIAVLEQTEGLPGLSIIGNPSPTVEHADCRRPGRRPVARMFRVYSFEAYLILGAEYGRSRRSNNRPGASCWVTVYMAEAALLLF